MGQHTSCTAAADPLKTQWHVARAADRWRSMLQVPGHTALKVPHSPDESLMKGCPQRAHRG